MLFNYSLDQNEVGASIFKSIINFFSKHRAYMVVLAVSVVLLVLTGAVAAIATAGIGTAGLYGRSIWLDMSSMSFVTKLDDFDLRDVINDLECR